MNRHEIYNQADMAIALGVTEAQVSQTLSGKRSARYATAVKWNRYAGGGIEIWMNPKWVEKRKVAFERYIKRNKRRESDRRIAEYYEGREILNNKRKEG